MQVLRRAGEVAKPGRLRGLRLPRRRCRFGTLARRLDPPAGPGVKALPRSACARLGKGAPAMTAILGISAYFHDSAAAVVIDGEVVAAAQEERFTRVKHDAGFPRNAVAFCLRQAGLRVEDLDHVGFYDKPLRKFERLLETY